MYPDNKLSTFFQISVSIPSGLLLLLWFSGRMPPLRSVVVTSHTCLIVCDKSVGHFNF